MIHHTSEDTICGQLANLTTSIAGSKITSELITETNLCLLDFLASTLSTPMTPSISSMAELFGTGPTAILHDMAPASITGATFAHGYLSTVEDIDDSHALASGMHLSATVFPAVLSIAQATMASQADVLRAAIAGYEIAGRLARSMDQGLRMRGFHASGAIGPFAACAAAGTLLKLDQQQMANAFGMAASSAAGLFAFLPSGADSRHLHAANAGVAGVVAATAAFNGATGPPRAFEGPDGFIGAYSTTCDLDIIFKPPPAEDIKHEIFNAYHKRFSACGHAIPGITLALELRENTNIAVSDIKSVEIFGYPASANLTNFPVNSISQAKFSLPILFSLAYLFGDISPEEMNMNTIRLPEVQALSQKVKIFEKDEHTAAFPSVRGGSMRVTMTDGLIVKLKTTTPIGMAGNRLKFCDVARKFDLLTRPVLGSVRCAHLKRLVSSIKDTRAKFVLT